MRSIAQHAYAMAIANKHCFVLPVTAMDPRPDPPPIHHQIPPVPQRKRKGRGTFVKVTTSTSSRKTTNYRIRKLADGRIGQQRADNLVNHNTIPERSEASDGNVNMGAVHDIAGDVPATAPTKSNEKKKRKAKSDTWAVCFRISLLGYT